MGKKSKRIYRTSQNIRIISVFLESLLSESLSLAGSHSPPHRPRMPSNAVLISGPAVGAAHILMWSYFYVLLPLMSTAIRTSAFSFVGALNDLFFFPPHIHFFFIYFYQLEANYFTILQWVLSYIDMNQPWIYMYSPFRSSLPPPSPPNPSGSSQCTRYEHLSHASHLGW